MAESENTMESKKLEALMMAVDLGSFTRAAEVLGYTQSGLTHMMNSLEKEIGFPLLERGRGLTEAELAALRTARLSEAVPLLGEGACTVQSGRASLTLPPVSACIFALK